MKKLFLFSFSLLLSSGLFSQSQLFNNNVSLGYLAHMGIQPGIKIGSDFTLKSFNSEGGYKGLFLSPQLAYFVNPEINNNFLLNVEFGYKTQKPGKTFYSAFSIGSGYKLQSYIKSVNVDLGSGDLSQNRELRHYFVPTINYEFGMAFRKSTGWYSKLTYGHEYLGAEGTSMIISIELGLKVYFSKN